MWSPYCIGLINQLESVHRRAARFIFQDYRHTSSVTNMLHILQWPTLEKKRVVSRAIMIIFKIINGLIDIPVEPPILTSNNLLTIEATSRNLSNCQQGLMHISIPFPPMQLEFGTRCLRQ